MGKLINGKVFTKQELSDMSKSCANHGKLPTCKTCTSKLSNQFIGNDQLIKDCYHENTK